MKNKIAQIIPVLRLKRDLHFFDYEIPAELQAQAQVGQLVEIPFRNKLIKGIVLNLSAKASESEYKLKPLAKIVEPLPFLAKWQLDLIEDLSKYYFVSMAVLLKMIVPEIPKRAKVSADKFFTDSFLTAPEGEINIDDFCGSSKPVLLQYSDNNGKIKSYLGLIEKALSQNKQVAIICPRLNNVRKIYQYLGDYKESISVFLNDLPKTKYWQEYQKIKSGSAKIIIGTRSAIFAPFKSLDVIIIDEEDNENHKQEEPNPRYNAKTVALKLRNLLGCKIFFASATPSLASLYKVEKKEWEYFKINGKGVGKSVSLQIKIIDKKDEFKKGNYGILSEDLKDSIEENLSAKRKIFLFLNRKGVATSVICKDCGYTASCPACKLPLAYFANKKLICKNCGHQEDLTLFCPKCKSPNIRLSGTGTEKVELEVKKLFPAAKVLKIDIDTPHFDKKISSYDIIIGTQFVFDYIDWSSVYLVGVVNADTLLYMPDYRSSEKTFSLLAKLAIFLNSDEKKMIVQTMAINNYLFKMLVNLDFENFYKTEIQERKDLSYPPVCRLVKLIYQSYEFNFGVEEVAKFYENIKSKIKNNEATVSAPALIHGQQVRGRFRWQMIMKIFDEKTSLDFLNFLPDDVIIDVEPESLL